jgi:hypothetical protein
MFRLESEQHGTGKVPGEYDLFKMVSVARSVEAEMLMYKKSKGM